MDTQTISIKTFAKKAKHRLKSVGTGTKFDKNVRTISKTTQTRANKR